MKISTSHISPPYKAEVFRIKPANFSSKVDVAACYICSDEKYLFLHRAKGTSQEHTWGIPAGKIESGETPQLAVMREVHEETGLHLKQQQIEDFGTLYVKYPHLDFTFHMFRYQCNSRPKIYLSSEHHDFGWATVEDALKLPLISGGRETLQQFFALAPQTALPRKEFYFVRHGETDVNAEPHIRRTSYDLPLNNNGIQQAHTAGQIASRLPINLIHSSPIQRAVETRDILLDSKNLLYIEDDFLSECEGEVWAKMVQLENGAGYEISPSVCSFLSRAHKGVGRALQKNGTVLIVAHGGIHWAICYHLGIEKHPWKIGNCEMVHFRPTDGGGWEARIIT